MNNIRFPRTAIRFPLQAEVPFCWIDKHGILQKHRGALRDISECGAFFLAAVCPPVQANIRLTICLEDITEVIGTSPIEIEGQVLRVECPSAQNRSGGFAILFVLGQRLKLEDILEGCAEAGVRDKLPSPKNHVRLLQ